MVKIRLKRRGRKKSAIYDIVIADSRSPRDGRFIEKIGTYNPVTNPATINLDNKRALYWMMTGAEPTETTSRILSYKGVLLMKHLQVGVNKGAITQEVADQRFTDWLATKEAKIQGKKDGLTVMSVQDKKARLDAETKVSKDREAARAKALQAALDAAAAAAAPAPAAEASEE